MKKIISPIVFLSIIFFITTSCKSIWSPDPRNDQRAEEIITRYTGSKTDLTLDIASKPVTHTIDISTSDGRAKLRNLTLSEAKALALTEAVMKSESTKLVDPLYTQLTKGKHVLRITVYGFPAVYKKQEK